MQTRQQTEAQIRAAARDWFIRLLNDPQDETRRACAQWRGSDPAHDKAFRQVETAWFAVDEPGARLAVAEQDELAARLRSMDRRKRGRRVSRGLLGAVALLAMLLGGGIWLENPHLLGDLIADHATGRAERRTIELADGSRVLLDADSAVAVEFDPTARVIRLLRGGASFDVEPSSTPFRVEAGTGDITALGTRFDVRISDDDVTVTLEHGRVAVSDGMTSTPAVLDSGQQLRYGLAGLGDIRDINLADETAWREGRFVFHRARLGDVIAEIARYRPGRLVIVSSTLSDERVTGSLNLNDTDAALASLQDTIGFRMFSLAGRLTVLQR